jgi:hypothetical protein
MIYTTKEADVMNGWGEFLDRDWSVFVTFTTPYRTTLGSARKKMDHLFTNLSNKYGKETTMFWVAEPFVDRHRFHMHALIRVNVPGEIVERLILNSWHQVSRPSGYSTRKLALVEKYDKSRPARYYVAKHLSKDNVDYDLFYV